MHHQPANIFGIATSPPMSKVNGKSKDRCETESAARREHFIPLTKAAMVRLLSDKLKPSARKQFAHLCRLLEATLHYEYHAHLEQLTQDYHAHNPDSDRLPLVDGTKSQSDDFFPNLERLADKANFHSLGRDEIQQAAVSATAWGVVLKVDFEQFDELSVYARGDSEETIEKCNWRTWYRTVEFQVPTYRRLLLAFRLRGEINIYMKLFKNIPHGDLEKLLPGGKVSMSWFDHAQVFAPTATGLAITAYKISKGALLLAFAGIYGLLAFLALVGGTIGYGLRSFHGYLRAKDKYRLSLTENLYYQNLDNNAGVIFRLLFDAEEQEFCEAVLAYFIFWQSLHEGPLAMEELDSRAEELLSCHDCGHVDFEASDAIEKLLRWGLITQEKQHYVAISIDAALAKLDATWDAYFPHSETRITGGSLPR